MLASVFIVALGATAHAATLCTLTPHSLRLEHNIATGADLGFTDVLAPRFSWQLQTADESRTTSGAVACRGSLQYAFRLQVSRAHDGVVAFDTGKSLSAGSTLVAPHAFLDGAPALDADTSYTIRVETWGSIQGDDATPSTIPGEATAYFHTALRSHEPADWEGSWLGGFTQLRATFALPAGKPVVSAAAYASGIGCFELTVNGAPAADDVALEPGFSTVPTVRQLYRAYDVTALLRGGADNAVGFRLGMCKYGYLDSFCVGAHGSTAACRAAILQLNIKFDDGTQFNVSTNTGGAWTGTTDANPVRYTHLFNGEMFDARLLEPFDEPGFVPANPTVWAAALEYDTSIDGMGELSLHTAPPIAVTERLAPISVTEVQSPAPPPSPSTPTVPLTKCDESFAAVAAEGDELALTCQEGTGTIQAIDFANFGLFSYGRFIKAASSTGVFWQPGSSGGNGTKHHVPSCHMCGIDACNTEGVTTSYINELASGDEFSCDMLGDCADFKASDTCEADVTVAVSTACIGEASCSVSATIAALGVSDPCLNIVKSLSVRGSGCTLVQPPTSSRSFIFDMGQNFAGVVSFDFKAAAEDGNAIMPAGTKLTFRHAEILHADGSLYNQYCGYPNCQCDHGNCANQTNQYITSGSEVKAGTVWKPRFTYHGFRFVQLDGWPFADSQPSLGTLTGLLTASAVPPLGNVHFSDPSMAILNSIQTMILYTQRSNLHSIPTDCPTREKRGWMGDAQWTAGQAALNFDMAGFYSNFMRTMGDTQEVECNQVANEMDQRLTEKFSGDPRRPPTYECCSKANPTFGCDWTGTNFTDVAGSLPDVVPYSRKTYGGWPGDPTWGVAAAVLPWEVYTRTGDSSSLAASYPVAKAFVDFLSRHEAPDCGLVEFGYYGDWCELEKTSKPAVTGWSHILGVARMADMAAVLGKTDDAAQYSAKLASLKTLYHAKYFNTKAGTYGSSQTANLLPLYLNITPPALVPSVAAAVADSLQKRSLGLSSGAMGTRYVFQALAQNGLASLALDVATATAQPSFGYMALQGPAGGGLGTGTVWEKWTGNAHDYGGASKNHPMFSGGIGVFLYQLAGIGQDALEHTDPTRVVFRPGAGDATVARRVGAASVGVSTPVGVARLAWRYEAEAPGIPLQFVANITVPVGLRQPAELHVQFGIGGSDGGCGALELVDMSHGAVVTQLLPGQQSAIAELSSGIAHVASVTAESKLEVHLLAGEFALVVRRSTTACVV